MCHERSARHGRKGGENKQDADNKGDELPELFINETNLPATAKELARLIAGLRDFVFNGTHRQELPSTAIVCREQ